MYILKESGEMGQRVGGNAESSWSERVTAGLSPPYTIWVKRGDNGKRRGGENNTVLLSTKTTGKRAACHRRREVIREVIRGYMNPSSVAKTILPPATKDIVGQCVLIVVQRWMHANHNNKIHCDVPVCKWRRRTSRSKS